MIDVTNAKSTLENRSLISFDVNLTSQERMSIEGFHLENEGVRTQKTLEEFNHFGLVDAELTQNLICYLSKLGNNPREGNIRISDLVARIVKIMMGIFDAEATRIGIRASLPSNKYDVPRWHRDQKYFTTEGKIYKLVFTIKGPPTRFAEIVDPKEYRRIAEGYTRNFNDNFTSDPVKFNDEDMRIRREIIPTLKEIDSFGRESAVIYLTGNKDAKVHSAPKLNEARLFMEVLVGTRDQINEWMLKKHSCDR